jgi:predicted dehydrogenase
MARLGIIGCGSVADFGHIPAILRTSGLELAALYDPQKGRAQKYATKFGAGHPTESLEDFFAKSIDAAIICSPLPAHHDNVLMCAENEVHVLCEKPIAVDEDEAADMIAVMEDANKGFFVGLVYRFSPVALQLKQWLRDGIIGDVRHFRMVYNWNLHGQYIQNETGAWVESPMWRGRMLEGGPLIDCGVHQIDLVRWMTGREVIAADGFGAWIAKYDSPDHITAHLQLEGGITATVEVSFTYGHTAREPLSFFSYELIGTGGVARFDRNGYVLEVRNGEKTIGVPGSGEKNFDGMYAQFNEYLNTGKSGNLATPQDAIAASEVAIECTDKAIARRITR